MQRFDPDFLTRLEGLALVSRQLLPGRTMAQRRSRRLGAGVEFADHREYVAGDDYRLIDWNLYARHSELFLKRFHEEEDLHVYLLLDASRSMAVGTPRKFDLACHLTAALAYLALACLDRVAVLVHAEEQVAEFPLTRGKGRIVALLEFLERLEPTGQRTDLARAARTLIQRHRRRGLTIVISDFFDPAGFQPGLDLLRYHRHEVQVVQVYDPEEAQPQHLGDLDLIDVETGTRESVTLDERQLEAYGQAFRTYQDELLGYCRRHGTSGTLASTAMSCEDVVLRLMRQNGAVE